MTIFSEIVKGFPMQSLASFLRDFEIGCDERCLLRFFTFLRRTRKNSVQAQELSVHAEEREGIDNPLRQNIFRTFVKIGSLKRL